MLIKKDNMYKIMKIDKKDFEKYKELGFFECDKSGNKIVSKPKKEEKKEVKKD
tara:strand:- start:6532 stop:6690 length:159 start_codon:yes stop_codon:yes gene_type:complete